MKVLAAFFWVVVYVFYCAPIGARRARRRTTAARFWFRTDQIYRSLLVSAAWSADDFFGLALGKTLARINRITHTTTYPPARSMLPRNRLELIDRPSPADDATTLRFFAALDPASSLAWTIAANRFIFSFGKVIVSSPDVLFLQTVHEPLIPKRFLRSPAGTTCNSSLQKSPGIHHRPQTMDRSPLLYLDAQSRKCASRSGTATAHSLRCHQFLSGR